MASKHNLTMLGKEGIGEDSSMTGTTYGVLAHHGR
ncbi:hypothetical protein FOCG_18552 [Fusarium oxysporum f. sp. radicis-lycopersici 26381]|nr:hypothetical protein FOCG_18552 [Fusarium oxysporum f. sp. radicis-lycopersici 26381]